MEKYYLIATIIICVAFIYFERRYYINKLIRGTKAAHTLSEVTDHKNINADRRIEMAMKLTKDDLFDTFQEYVNRTNDVLGKRLGVNVGVKMEWVYFDTNETENKKETHDGK